MEQISENSKQYNKSENQFLKEMDAIVSKLGDKSEFNDNAAVEVLSLTFDQCYKLGKSETEQKLGETLIVEIKQIKNEVQSLISKYREMELKKEGKKDIFKSLLLLFGLIMFVLYWFDLSFNDFITKGNDYFKKQMEI